MVLETTVKDNPYWPSPHGGNIPEVKVTEIITDKAVWAEDFPSAKLNREDLLWFGATTMAATNRGFHSQLGPQVHASAALQMADEIIPFFILSAKTAGATEMSETYHDYFPPDLDYRYFYVRKSKLVEDYVDLSPEERVATYGVKGQKLLEYALENLLYGVDLTKSAAVTEPRQLWPEISMARSSAHLPALLQTGNYLNIEDFELAAKALDYAPSQSSKAFRLLLSYAIAEYEPDEATQRFRMQRLRPYSNATGARFEPGRYDRRRLLITTQFVEKVFARTLSTSRGYRSYGPATRRLVDMVLNDGQLLYTMRQHNDEPLDLNDM